MLSVSSGMDELRNPNCWDWELLHPEEGLEELRKALLWTTLELEKTIESGKEEITVRELQLIHVSNLLSRAIRERDEALSKYQALLSEKLTRQNVLNQHKFSITEGGANTTISSSCSYSLPEETLEMVGMKPLPEQGRLLQAVMAAGPLLQTLVMVGEPLPQWQHPPPKLNSSDIPPAVLRHLLP